MARRQEPDWDDFDYDPTSEINNSWSKDEPTPAQTAPTDTPPVTVQVDDAGLVTSVALAPDWKSKVDPRDLPTTVLSAVQTATMQILATKAEQVDLTGPEPGAAVPSQPADDSPLSPGDVQRLVDEVYADLDRVNQQLSERVGQPYSTVSAGGHVRGSASNGRILDLSIDPTWSSTARNAEIESELNEVLKRLCEQSTPGELASGLQSPAINELNTLARNPQQFLRRLGLPPQA